jgi:hypothetical protein
MAGGAGADSFSGRPGDDMLLGGARADRLDGGDGERHAGRSAPATRRGRTRSSAGGDDKL